MNLYRSALCVGGALQYLQAGARQLVLRVGGVVRPGEDHLAGLHERADVVNVLVGFVVVDPALQPDDLLRSEVLLQPVLYLLLGKPGIAPGAKQAGFGGEYRPLTVGVYRAALQHESGGVVHAFVIEVAELARHAVVLVPGEVQTVLQTAPGVEAPVYSAYNLTVCYKSRGVIPRPAVVAGHLDHPDMRREHSAGVFVLLVAGADGDFLAPGDSLADPDESLARGVGAVLPGIRALRKYQNAAVMLREFRRHIEAVLLRRCVKYSHADLTLLRLSCRTSPDVCRGKLPS